MDEKEKWLNSPEGATIRRGIAFVVGLVALFLPKYLGIEMQPADQIAVVTLVTGYIFQSVYKSGKVTETKAAEQAREDIKNRDQAINELREELKRLRGVR